MNISVLMTCFNRREKTLSCLYSLFTARDTYNLSHISPISLFIFLTDDGCTDGTADAVKQKFGDENINVCQGTGNLYWAGGMRLAWKKAISSEKKYDYYLLLNDDTDLFDSLFDELFSTQKFSIDNTGSEGLVSGITSSKTLPYVLTYGGVIWKNKFLGTKKRLGKMDTPQLCDLTNANILLIPSHIVDKVGIFYEGYIHGFADYDYANMVKKAGFPIWVTANYCGRCDRDHDNHKEIYKKIKKMSLAQRISYYKSPLHSLSQNLLYARRVTPFRVPLVCLGNFLHVYFPSVLYYIGNFRYNK